jgi:hypothetical protein
MAQRLNKALREEIFNNAIAGAYHTNKYEARRTLWKISREVYEEICRPLAKQIKKLPTNMVQNSTTMMRFRFKPKRGVKTIWFDVYHAYKYGFSNDVTHYHTTDSKNEDVIEWRGMREMVSDDAKDRDAWPFHSQFVLDMKYMKVPAKTSTKLLKAYKAYHKTMADYEELSRTLNGILQSAYSVEKLIEIWPNAAQYLPAMPVVGQAMVINIPHLEALLDASR